jgi:hypothetical protein
MTGLTLPADGTAKRRGAYNAWAKTWTGRRAEVPEILLESVAINPVPR